MTDTFEIACRKADAKEQRKRLRHPDPKHDLVKLLNEKVSIEQAWTALNALPDRAASSGRCLTSCGTGGAVR